MAIETVVQIPADTSPPSRPDPHGWAWNDWKAIGFQPQGDPPWRIPAGCAVVIRYGDLLGPDDGDPWRHRETVRYEAS
jgi:hypothetical protein